MGWYFEGWRTRSELIEELTRNSRYRQRNGPTIISTCLAHCCRGGAFSAVLWSVWQETLKRQGCLVEPVRRWIRCDLMSYGSASGWGVKSLGEISEPLHYSCPLAYLKMVPVVKKRWRARVREYHRMVRAKRDMHTGASVSVSQRMGQPPIWPVGRQNSRLLLAVAGARSRKPTNAEGQRHADSHQGPRRTKTRPFAPCL